MEMLAHGSASPLGSSESPGLSLVAWAEMHSSLSPDPPPQGRLNLWPSWKWPCLGTWEVSRVEGGHPWGLQSLKLSREGRWQGILPPAGVPQNPASEICTFRM